MKPGRNAPCPCGSGRKHKMCCGARSAEPAQSTPAQDAIQLLQRAVEAHGANRLDEAEKLYREMLAGDPRNANAKHMLGVLLAQTGKIAAGIDLIMEAIALEPDNAEAHSNLGSFLNVQRRFAEARQAYETAISLKPDYVAAYNNLGLIHQDERRFASARKSRSVGREIRWRQELNVL